MEQEQIMKIESELLELKVRARNAGYKNIIPRLPKKLKNKETTLQMSVMSGFRKRLTNWKNGLITMENPGGLNSDNSEKKSSKLSESIVTLAEHFNEPKQ